MKENFLTKYTIVRHTEFDLEIKKQNVEEECDTKTYPSGNFKIINHGSMTSEGVQEEIPGVK